jgi:hypothetical protein
MAVQDPSSAHFFHGAQQELILICRVFGSAPAQRIADTRVSLNSSTRALRGSCSRTGCTSTSSLAAGCRAAQSVRAWPAILPANPA